MVVPLKNLPDAGADSGNGDLSPEAKELGNVFGHSEDDLKKASSV